MKTKNNILNKTKANQMSFLSVLTGFLILLIMNLAGCKKDDTSTVSGDLQVVPREAAYAGCYTIVGTSQTGIWDATGNSITTVLGEAFFGQDAQFTHTTPAYTKSSDGLTVKDEVTGLTWQKTYDSGTYYWASIQTVVDNLNKQNYGGYSDWRVPTIKELYSLWDASVGWPYINTAYFDIKYTDEQELSHAIFWSSDKYTGVLGN
ncbi:MAG: DUF1566 domain-containing protein, partial [Bacteroidales bacterium]